MTVVYTKPNCPQCTATIRHLEKRGIAYDTAPIDDAVLERARIFGFTAAPMVRVDNGDGNATWWAGYRPDEIDRLAA